MGSKDKVISGAKRKFLKEDVDSMIRILQKSEQYDFSEDLRAQIRAKGFSANELAKRCGVSHTIVNKWLSNTACPNGRERMKELGMALGMDADAIDRLLHCNHYPRLYAKNPMDDVCKLMLKQFCGEADLVERYRIYLKQYKLKEISLQRQRVSFETADLSRSLYLLDLQEDFAQWMEHHIEHFSARDKTMIASRDLIRFMLLYLGEHSIHGMYVENELPLTIRNLLYPLIRDEEIAVRGFRKKLIVFGLYNNMSEEEIDKMLGYADLLPITESSDRVDLIILTAIRYAHERYPYYEYLGSEQCMNILIDYIVSSKNRGKDAPTFYEELLDFFQNKFKEASTRILYYENIERGRREDLFELYYTDYSDKRLMHYVQDILLLLSKESALSEKEISEYLEWMKWKP